MDPTASLAADTRSLDSLKAQAATDPKAVVGKVATQFEALFMQQVVKSMRDATPKSGLLSDSTTDMYTGMLDSQLAQHLAGLPGGLRAAIERQLLKNMPSAQTAGGDAAKDARIGGLPPQGLRLPGVAVDASELANDGALAEVVGAVPATDDGPAGDDDIAIGAGTAADAASLAFGAGSLRPVAAADAQVQAARAAAAQAAGASPVQTDFVRKVWAHAAAAQRTTGVPAHFVVGQAALESGWGRHEIRMPDGRSSYNLFGIKATGDWHGRTVDVTTTEYVSGKPYRVVQRFRAYDSYAEAFRDWASLMGGKARYGDVIRASGNVSAYAHGMQKAGYATDPHYGQKLEKTINKALAIKRLVV